MKHTKSIRFPKESSLSGTSVDFYTNEERKEFIMKLLDCMSSLEDLLIHTGLAGKQQGYCNDLSDAIHVLYLKERPDGDNQYRLRKELRKGTEHQMDFFEAYQSLLIRISNMTESLVEVNMTRY